MARHDVINGCSINLSYFSFPFRILQTLTS